MSDVFSCLKGSCTESFPNPARRDTHMTTCSGKKTCNMHTDCGAADERAKASGKDRAAHCWSDDCEDCFPK